MGELLVPANSEFPVQLVVSIVCSIALGVYAALQPGADSDDDDGPGGGLMQPVTVGAR